MIVLESTLRRVEAERDEARWEAEHLVTARAEWFGIALKNADRLRIANAEIADLRARLAKWEEPKPRGLDGRFVGKAAGEGRG